MSRHYVSDPLAGQYRRLFIRAVDARDGADLLRYHAQDVIPGLSYIGDPNQRAAPGGAREHRASGGKWFTPAQPPPRPEPVSEEEFKALLKASEFQGEVEPQERELIHRVFDFGHRRAAEVMTPREKMFKIDVATPPERLIAEVVAGHFSRIPIYRGNPDNIIGILHVKDIVLRGFEAAAPRLERMVRPANFIPPSRPLGELFDEMRRGRFQLAIVVNEYGRLLGLITLEDLLEELFGEIRDEFDYDGPEVLAVSDNEWLVSGAIETDRLKRALANSDVPGASELFARI